VIRIDGDDVRDLALGSVHLALVLGKPEAQQETLVRVHEPLSILDLLDAGTEVHVATDAVASRTEANREIGLKKAERAGAVTAIPWRLPR
jgi:GTP cyclohydrolase II